jgi:hypothetical protein
MMKLLTALAVTIVMLSGWANAATQTVISGFFVDFTVPEPSTLVLLGGNIVARRLHRGRNEGGERPDAATEELVQALRGTPTDLAKLVTRVHQRPRHFVGVSPNAIARWQMDAPGAWERVNEWLITRGVTVIYC